MYDNSSLSDKAATLPRFNPLRQWQETMSKYQDAKQATDLVKLIEQSETLRRDGKYMRGVKHDSLVVDVADQRWHWNSRGLSGDAIDWLTLVCSMVEEEAVAHLLASSPTRVAATEYTAPKKERKPIDFTSAALQYHQYLINNKLRTTQLMEERSLTVDALVLAVIGWYEVNGQRGWSIPYLRSRGSGCDGIKIRLHGHPTLRYRGITGSRFGLYETPYHHRMRKDLLFVVEGEFKALHIWQLGARAVATSNNMWASNKRKKEYRQQIRSFRADEVYVVRDNDLGGLKFMTDVCEAVPNVIRLAPPPQWKGVDDWILGEKVISIGQLIREGKKHV